MTPEHNSILLPSGLEIPKIHWENFQEYEPKIEWFLRPHEINGIHGIGHMARVLVLQELISEMYLKDNPEAKLDRVALRWAAATHDTRRIDDTDDIFHGHRAAEFASYHLVGIVPNTTRFKVMRINNDHVLPDIVNMYPELAVFKDADALDRARSKDLNLNLLRLGFSKQLVGIGQELFERSSFYETKVAYSPFHAVKRSAMEIGII